MLQTNELTVIALTKWGVGIKRASINLSSTALSTAWLAYHSCVEGYRVVVQSGNSMGQAFKEALNSHQKNVDIELWRIQRWYSNYLHYASNAFCVLYVSVSTAWISETNQAYRYM